MRRRERISGKERQRRAAVEDRIEKNVESMAALHNLNRFVHKWKKKQGDVTQNEKYKNLFAASAEADYQLSVRWKIERTAEGRIAKASPAGSRSHKRRSERLSHRQDV